MKDMKNCKREEKWVTLTHLKFKGNASIHALYFKPNWMGQSWHKKLMTFSHSWGIERWKSWGRGGPSPTGNRPWPAPWHEQWAAGVAVCLQDQEEVLQGVQEEAHGPDQKLWKKKKEAPTNETRCGRDPPQENGHRPRDDWHHCWCSQRQGLHTGWGQVWDDRTLLRRVLQLLQTTKKDKPHVTIKVPCLFKPEYPLDSASSSLSYDNSPQTLHLLFKFQFLFKSVEIILAAQCWKRGETNDNVIRLMKCANFVEIMKFKKCNFLCLM